MSMKATIIGIGAAGNKAAITLLDRNIISKDYIKLLNTTPMDIPSKYKSDNDLFYLIPSQLGGAGKEPAKGRASIIKAIKEKVIIPEQLLNEDSKEIILVSSTEGGSGSGTVPVLSKYFDSMNIPVHVFAFIGFQDEVRGINNTLKFFKELPANVVLHTIINSHFLDYTKNYSKAEQAANEEFANEVEILLGHKLVQSKQNIDNTDLYKINTQPGYMTISHVPLTGIKNVESFNAAVAKIFENPSYMDNDQSVKRMAVIINASKRVQEAIDNSFEVVKRYVGIPIETFQHIQPDNESDLIGDEYIDIMACGMNYPEKPIKDMNNNYNKLKEKLNTSRKSFADIYDEIDLEDEVDEFNMDIKRKNNAASIEDLFGDEVDSTIEQVQQMSPKRIRHISEIEKDQGTILNEKDEIDIPSKLKPNKLKSSNEESVDVSELKNHRFVNTTVNQDIYSKDYYETEVDVDESENPMQQQYNFD